MKKLLVLLMLFNVSVLFAAGSEVGTVIFEHGQDKSSSKSAGKTFFFLNGVKKNNPYCATIYRYGNGERWVINNDWPAAKFQLDTLLAAKLAGKKVRVVGSGDCGVWGDSETAIDIRIE